jgi:hypothetical protein
MEPAPYLHIAFLVSGGTVAAAVDNDAGETLEFVFENTEAGIANFGRWLDALPCFGDETMCDAAIASEELDEASLMQTPVFQFAYAITRNTEVWSRNLLDRCLHGARPTAEAVLRAWSPMERP